MEFHSIRSCQAGFLVVRFVAVVAVPAVEDVERAGAAVLGMARLTSFLRAAERILVLGFEGDVAVVLRDVGWIFFHEEVLDGDLLEGCSGNAEDCNLLVKVFADDCDAVLCAGTTFFQDDGKSFAALAGFVARVVPLDFWVLFLSSTTACCPSCTALLRDRDFG